MSGAERDSVPEASPRKPLPILFGAFLFVLVLDQVTKAIVVATIPLSPPYRPETFFYFTHQRNTGLVGGAFSDMPFVAFVAPVLATLVLIYLYRHLDSHSRAQHLAYGMVLGGAVGNFIDRIRLQGVTDFLQVHFYFIPFDFPWKFYPAFNVADSGIVVGVVILVIAWGREAIADAPGSV